MATLVFTALGSVLGGPLFAAAGALAGSAIDMALMGSPTREGSRLSVLSVTTSSYGDTLPRHFGRMRVPGTVIWATDLVEHASTSGGGKGKPKLKTYTYSCSFAVALGSRPIAGIGRIWADGNLLRGTDGALKVGGSLRFHSGEGDQSVDPLIAAAEGNTNCPAWRGLAYVVFEDLQLADFGNRIPALNFEIFADDGTLTLAQLFDGVIDDFDANVPLEGVVGVTCEGTPADALAQLLPVFPVHCDASGERLVIAPERMQAAPVQLGEAATSNTKGDFGTHAGYVRQRSGVTENPPRVLRYCDVERDFQPGLQRAVGRALPGQPRTIELPAALTAADAQRLIAGAASAHGWARETLQWRTTELDPAVGPGAVVTALGQSGIWRVLAWEWRESGVELSLERITPLEMINGAANAGRANLAADLQAGETALVAFELPWDGVGSGDSSLLFAACSSAGAGWQGAELSADSGNGELAPLGPSGRARNTIGTMLDTLPPASPHLVDRSSQVTVALISPDMAFDDATTAQLAAGANRALIGAELVQFGRAVPLGGGHWRLENFMRGRGGTEYQIDGHVSGESFVLLDDAAVALDSSLVGDAAGTMIAAIGIADAAAVESQIIDRGLSLQPLTPVHPRAISSATGLSLEWTRRARGAWTWLDGVETPLHEQAEAYEVTYGLGAAVAGRWEVSEPLLSLSPTQVSALQAQLAGGAFVVRQRGTYALSPALLLTQLS